MKKRHLLLMPLMLFSFFSYSQVNVTVDIQEQRFLNEVSSLERSKFFVIHTVTNGDPQVEPFMAEYNVGFGRRFFGPFNSATRTDGQPTTYPAYTPGTTNNSVRNVRRFVATNHPGVVFRYNDDLTEAANWAAEYWLDVTNDNGRPEFWEPMNEPFVHSGDFSTDAVDGKMVIKRMAEWFGGLAKKVKETPELANMKMLGYSSAWPSMERFDFGHWQDRMKVFIDIAGPDIDAVSVHPYDGFNVTGQDSRRSGSNSEAILDLIETYTNQKFGTPKPLAITEYGIIEKGYPDTYSETESALSIRGINQMLFNFLEREDNMAIAVPFITGKATFHYNNQVRSKPYVPALFRPLNQLATAPFTPSNWVTSYKENFYKLWSDVKGNRNFINSDDFDVQVQSFVDGTKAHIIVNNLDDASKTISLNMLSGTTGITSVTIKSLKVYNSKDPSYTVTDTTTLPSSLTLDEGETVVMTITYDSAPTFTKSIVRKKYYGVAAGTVPANRAPTVPLAANTANTFNFDNVDLSGNLGGVAMLRLGVGIPLESSGLDRLPSAVKVNGVAVSIPTNWKGYDQANRLDFFGVIEIPVDRSILKQGANTASVTYAKAGGRISSVVLSIENKDTACTAMTFYADGDNDGLGDPNQTIESCVPIPGYVDNGDDRCPNDKNNNCSSTFFTVKNIGETCPGADNGKILIEANNVGDYAVTLGGQSVTSNFTKTHEISKLAAGSHTLTIIDNTTRDTFEFKIAVLEPQKLAVKTTVSQPQKQVVLELEGGKEYRINLNGIKFTTTQKMVTLSLMRGKNNISVHADADCQGEFKKTITLFDEPVAYPVPMRDVLNINLGNDTSKDVTVTIHDASGRVINTEIPAIDSSNIVKINTSGLNSGLYFLSIETEKNSSIIKIEK